MNKNGTEYIRSWAKSLFNRKGKETLEEDTKNKPRRDIKHYQNSLMVAARYVNPGITAGEFAAFHNESMKEIR